ncbi:F-box/LRR-repeat protein 7-like [Anoplophora glabripennis]|uniref:F-box/LRR-repeat protein 7-like n=1 Tax=Anoplophora glabripennis TaxID=217634 RepID=UPI00087555D9|nr:F-box/LRR-repeat protein 7-like [Anoplophora glabripennis]XP_018566550.1 F-box/LRR-repeat protein 7-like [Anoplophora glabripennis]
MNQPSGLLERLSPRCPLVRLGHSSSTDETATSTEGGNYPAENYNYRSQYIDSYENNTDRRFHNKQLSIDNSYLQKQSPESEYLQNYYQPHSYLNERTEYQSKYELNSRQSPLNHNNLSFQNKNSLDLSSFSLGPSYWDHENYDKIQNSQSNYFRTSNHQMQETNYLLDNFTKLGKSSPSLDQGYHTLVSPSPGPVTPNLWTDGNLYKGKKYQSKNNSFDRLPDELVTKIFSFLTSIDLSICAQVCRRFDILAWTPSLWRVITLEGEVVSGDRAIRGVLRQLCGQGRTGACPSVERVHVTNGAKLSDKSLLLLARRCPELTHLQLQGCSNITNHALSEVVTRCNNLQHLDVTGCVKISCININAGPEPPRRLQLQYLDLTDCVAVQDSGLRIIVQNCPQLAYLYLRRCVQITDAGLKFVPSFCSGLRELSVSDCSNLTDFGLYELAKLGATLRYLSVAKCDQVSDAGLKVIARKCYKLRYLNARGCEAVSDDAITVLARSCTRLRALDIGKCDVSDAGLRALAESCPNLKKLSLRNCDLVTDRGVQCVAYYCRGLQQLNIQDCQISLEGYRAVKKYCKRCVIEHTNPGFF